MPTHTMKTFYGRLKKHGPERAYYLLGTEDLLKDEAVSRIIDGVLDDSLKPFNLDQLQAAQVDPAALADMCATLPMMADRRVVVVRGVEAWKRKTRTKKAALGYLENPAPETILILIQSATDDKVDKALAGAAYTVDFSRMAQEETMRWLKREADRNHISFEPGAADHLLTAVGGDLAVLGSELAKLSALGSKGPVTTAQVADTVGIRQGETLTDWRDAVMAGNAAGAVALTESILNQSGNTAVRLVMALGTALVGTGVARAHYDDGKRGRTLQNAVFHSIKAARPMLRDLKWGDEAAKWASWAPHWPEARVDQAIRAARQTDELLKGTHLSDQEGVLTDLIMRLAPSREVLT